MEKEIVKLGGKKVLDKTAERDNGWFANFVDLEGNRFGVFEANLGDGCGGDQ
jgi:predicted enzyme related to lactoylglutathione lyase